MELIKNYGFIPNIVEYIQAPPDAETVLRLADQLGVSVVAMLRPGEDDYAALLKNIAADDDAALAAGLKNHPRALQRPIVVDEDRGMAVIGRPPENVLELLPK